MTGQEIWIAEDDADDVLFYREAFQALGVRSGDVLFFNDGEALLRRFRQSPEARPALLVVGGQMPRANGVEVIKALKAWGILPKLKAVLLTGLPTVRDEAIAKACGVPLFRKPTTSQEMKGLLADLSGLQSKNIG